MPPVLTHNHRDHMAHIAYQDVHMRNYQDYFPNNDGQPDDDERMTYDL